MNRDRAGRYSVLMPVYAGEQAEYFRQAVESMMKQSIPAAEFVLVCDGPLTEELEYLIERFCKENPEIFHIIRLKENVGICEALKTGVKACRSELIARMDSDDIACPYRCEQQLKAFIQNSNLALCSGTVAEFELNPSQVIGYRNLPCTHEEILRLAKRRNPMNHMAVMMKKAAVLNAGNYRQAKGAEDYYLWVRMLLRGYQTANLDSVLVYARIGNGMIERRGGWKYAGNMVQLQRLFYKTGFLSLRECLSNCVVRIGVSLLPVMARKRIYRKRLRSREKL